MAIDYDLAHAQFDSREQNVSERNTFYLENWRFYEGDHRKFLKVKDGGIDDNVIINFCGVLVDRTVSRLFGDPVRGDLLSFDLEDEATDADNELGRSEGLDQARRTLQAVWERSGGLHALLSRLGTYGAVTGHFVIRVVEDGDVPRLVAMDPALLDALVRQDDRDTVIAYSIQFPVMRRDKDGDIREADFRQLILYGPVWSDGDYADGWYVRDFVRLKPKVSGELRLRDDEPEVPRWRPESDEAFFEYCPIQDGQNLPNARSYWGRSDLKDVKHVNDEINFVLSNVNRIIRFNAHPRTVAIGVEPKQIQETAVESLWSVATTPDKAKIYNLEMESELPAVFGFFQIIREAFWTIGREADPSVFKEKIGNVTNFGLRVLYMDALNKLGQKRQSYGSALSAVLERCLQIVGIEGLHVVPAWNDPLPTDPRETVQTLQMERDMEIVSRETAALERGRNWEIEKRRMQADAQSASVSKRLWKLLQGGGVNGPDKEDTSED